MQMHKSPCSIYYLYGYIKVYFITFSQEPTHKQRLHSTYKRMKN